MKTWKNDWLEKVEEAIAGGMSADAAILKVKADYPELVPLAGQFFEDKVAENFKAGLGKTAAVKKAVEEFPGLHANWLKRLPTGQKNTKDLFPR